MNQVAGCSSRNERISTRRRNSPQTWESAKLDIHRIYIQENNTLEDTIAAIQGIHGIQAKPRRWNDKLKEWGFRKNVTNRDMQIMDAIRMKRAREGKDTEFIYRGARVANEKFENFKRRKTREELPSVATHDGIIYHTPGHDKEGASPEGSIRSQSSPSQLSGLSDAQLSSIASSDPEWENPLTSVIDVPRLPQAPHHPMLDRYISENCDPWFLHPISEQIRDHNTVLENLKEQFDEVNDLHLSDEQSSSPGLCCLENQFFLESYSFQDNALGEQTAEAAALDDLLGLAVILAESNITYGRFARQTMLQEFKLANAVESNGYHDEAEWRCRRILHWGPQTSVDAFLGMILANDSRLVKSTFYLFRALASFIINFDQNSVEGNATLFEAIERLFTELILRSQEDWSSLTYCMIELMDTMKRAASDGSFFEIHDQLFIYGFRFAHECVVLGFIDPAKHLYYYLLQHSTATLDVTVYAFEKAKAHQIYALLLREEGKRTSSAEQLSFACESAIHSGPHTSRLKSILDVEFADLPYLALESDEDEVLGGRIRDSLSRIRQQGDEDTISSMGSKNGMVTYPSSVATGVSNSMLMTA